MGRFCEALDRKFLKIDHRPPPRVDVNVFLDNFYKNKIKIKLNLLDLLEIQNDFKIWNSIKLKCLIINVLKETLTAILRNGNGGEKEGNVDDLRGTSTSSIMNGGPISVFLLKPKRGALLQVFKGKQKRPQRKEKITVHLSRRVHHHFTIHFKNSLSACASLRVT